MAEKKQYDFSDFDTDPKTGPAKYDFSDFDRDPNVPKIKFEKPPVPLDDEIATISAKYDVPVETLKSRQIGMGYYPEHEAKKNIEEGKYGEHLLKAASSSVNSVLGEGLLGGLPSFVTKKLATDNEEKAYDELRSAVDKRKSGGQNAQELILSATPAVAGTKAIKALGMGGKYATPAAEAAVNIGEAARGAIMESNQGQEFDAAKMGAGIGAAFEAAPFVAKGVTWLGKEGGKKAGRILTNVDEAAAEHYLANPEAVNAAKPLSEVTDQFVNTVRDQRKALSESSGESYKLLKDSGKSAEINRITDPLNQASQKIGESGAYSKARVKAMKSLEDLAERVAEEGDSLPLDKGKSLLTQLDTEISALAKKKKVDPVALQSMRNARAEIDKLLKEEVPQYAEHMKGLAEETRNLVGVSDTFRTPEGAQKLLRRIQLGKAEYPRRAIENMDKSLGTDFLGDLKNSRVKDVFSLDSTNGSRKTVLGGLVGMGAGAVTGNPILGPLIGGAIGGAADKYGGQIYKKILDGSLKIGKYGDALKKVFELKGPAAVYTAHQTLMGEDPKYVETIHASAYTPPGGQNPVTLDKMPQKTVKFQAAPKQQNNLPGVIGSEEAYGRLVTNP